MRVALALFACALAGCSAAPTPSPSPTATPVEVRAPTATVPAPTPTAEPTLTASPGLQLPPPPTPNPDTSAFIDYLLPRVDDLSAVLARLQAHLGQLRTSPLLFVEQEWQRQMIGLLDELQSMAEDLRKHPVIPLSMRTYEPEIQTLIKDVEFAVEEYNQALRNDPEGAHLFRAGRSSQAAARQAEAIGTWLRLQRPPRG